MFNFKITTKNSMFILDVVSLLLSLFLLYKVDILPIITTTTNIISSIQDKQDISVDQIKTPELYAVDYFLLSLLILFIVVKRASQKNITESSIEAIEVYEDLEDFKDLYDIRIKKKKGWESVLDYNLLTLAKEKGTSLEQIKSIFYDYYFRKHPIDQSGSRALYWLKLKAISALNNLVIIVGVLAAIIPIYNWVNEVTKGNAIAEEKAIQEAWDNLAKYAKQSGNLGRQAKLEFLNKKGILLYSVDLTDSALPKINLENADLQYSIFNNSKLTGACFNNTTLNYASFIGAELSNAKLIKSKLIQTNLTNANLTDADLTGANLTGANLTGANLTNAKGLTTEQLKKSKVWKSAKYSDNFLQNSGICQGKEKPNQCPQKTFSE